MRQLIDVRQLNILNKIFSNQSPEKDRTLEIDYTCAITCFFEFNHSNVTIALTILYIFMKNYQLVDFP